MLNYIRIRCKNNESYHSPPKQVKRLVNKGHEIGSHTHLHQLVYEETSQQFKEDLKRSIHTLEDCTGEKVKYFSAPGFSITNEALWAFEVLLENGITIDSSVFPASRAHGGFEQFALQNPL